MRDQRNHEPVDEPASQDVLEHAVLHLVLSRHPAQLSFDELVRATGDPAFLVQDAVTELTADGLLHRNGEFVLATRAAVRFDELSM